MRSFLFGPIICLGVVLTLSTPVSYGQTSAQLTGVIRDSSGAVITNATVTVTNVDTGLKRTVVSNQLGYYSAPLLPPGRYQMSVELQGFKPVTRSGITLEVNQVARVDFTLEVGAVTERVEVFAAAPTVERETAALGAVIDNQKIVNLPLNGRNPYALALLAPGVLPSTLDTTRGAVRHFNATTFQVNGGRVNTSAFLVDGVNNTTTWSESFNTVSTIPSVEAVQEFKVQTNAYSAEFGRSGGGVINVVLKSGTNAFHGALYEFLRNSKLDANNFFANRAGRPLASFKRSQFGGSLGGPILREKAFFFVNYEGLRDRTATSATFTVPTAVQKQGDFQQTFRRVGSGCVPVNLYDPTTTRRNPAGPGFIRDPFPGNAIPLARFDRVAQNMMRLYPEPNSAGDACTGINNYFSAKSAKLNVDQMDIKLDWVPTVNNRFSVGLGWRERDEIPPNHYGTMGNTAFAFIADPSKSGRVNYTRILRPDLILNSHFALNRVERVIPPHGADLKVTDFGFPQILQDQMTKPVDTPFMGISGYGGIGNSCCAFAFLADNTYNWTGDMTWVRGRHTIKFGGEFRIHQDYEHTGFGSSGSFSFGPSFTQGPDPNAPAPNRGDGFASFMLGTGTGNVQTIPGVLTSNRYMGLFLQDDIKLTPRLTINMGLRYDLENGRDERQDKLSFFDFDAASPLAASVPGFPNLKGGLRFVGVDANRQFDIDKNNFGPRFGLAYSLNPKTVVRTGYGIFYLPYIGAAAGAGAGIAGFQSFTPWLSSLDGLTPLNYLSNGFPRGLDLPTGSSLGLLTNVGSSFGSTDRDGAIDRTAKVAYMQQWNFNIQRELPSGMSLELAYAGSKGTKLPDGPRGHQMNQLRSELLTLGTALQELVPNPFFGTITTAGPLSQPTVTRAQLLRPYPHFLGLLNFRPDSASSIYHAFQLRFQKRLADGGTVLVAYTNSKLIADSDNIVSWQGQAPGGQNVYNRRAERSLSGMDVSQRLAVSYVLELPFGRGQRFGSQIPGWLNHVLGNWRVNGITTFQRGVPVAGVTAPNNSQSFSDSLRANVNGNPKLSGGRPTSEKLARWFDTTVLSQPPAFTFGNAPRTLPNVRVDGIKNFDFSLFKGFPFGEEKRLEFRAEAFNLFNTPQFGFPGTFFGTPALGVVSSQVNIPRQIQLGLKFAF